MKYSFPPLITTNSRILILGTMPGEKSLQCQEYYGNKQNHFWKILFKVFDRTFTADYESKKILLEEFDLALWDVLERCERQGSLDSKIKGEIPNDLMGLLRKFPNIKYIVFSSKNAEKYFYKYFTKTPELEYVTLPSPSGANATMRLDQKIENWKKITQL
ncbi:DNA-deoxyinosine glycosylase [Flavobacterium sp. NKUCC04_CG]|uniref:DNA-deoxyinosine glycosylase n=1 Tax=Flavobacterium sp. NKUCC04_CG TaxID=2842121 RepID=UPI001C5B70BD|nr:DNA-deoxyinosine glycosylase [Flavobacterium sp. NKUCC04_CG]MBW3519462.1 DNA-deoxyinosine glycosylase [Flavobacterium sp. NKUCC04_CG]